MKNKQSYLIESEQRFITVEEFAKKMSITQNWAYQMVKKGLVPIRSIGAGRYRIDWEAYCQQGLSDYKAEGTVVLKRLKR